MTVPFTKAHGAKNDFLLTWEAEAPREDLPRAAQAICDRHTGVGADGWMIVTAACGAGGFACHNASREAVRQAEPPAPPTPADYDAAIRLFNSDGSEPEVSGNGTRCAAAFLFEAGLIAGDTVRIATGAGVKSLRLIERKGHLFLFEMNMGKPVVADGELHLRLPLAGGTREVSALNVGNPQCAVFVDDFDFGWRALGIEIESHPHFPKRTNVSFVRPVDRHTIDVRFWERGAGETMSSGTGSTGAMAAAVLRGAAASPVRVLTPAGPLDLRWNDDIYLTGPAEIVAGGEFYF